MVGRLAADKDAPEDDVRDVLEDAGLVRGYYAWLGAPLEDGEELSTHVVLSYVFEFADEDGAADAWDYLEEDAEGRDAEDIDGFDDFGDASEATLVAGGGDEPYLQLDVTVLLGNLHVGISVIDWTGEEPDEDLAAELTGYALESVENGFDADQPALSNLVVRLEDSVNDFYDLYLLRDGEATWLFRETPEDAESDLEEAEDAGITAEYRVGQRIAAATDESVSALYYLTVLRFEDEDAAGEFVSGQQDAVAEDENYTDFEIDDADYGDGGFTYGAVSTDGGVHYRGITFQSGDLVVMIDVGGPIMPSEDAVGSIADAQIECIESDGCLDPVELSPDLEDYVDQVTESNEDQNG
jgi:hypothetical protein